MGIHQDRTHPTYVHGCDQCRWSSVQLDHQALETRDHVRNNIARTHRIIASRQEKHMSMTDLRYGRRTDRKTQDEVAAAPNIDGVRPREL